MRQRMAAFYFPPSSLSSFLFLPLSLLFLLWDGIVLFSHGWPSTHYEVRALLKLIAFLFLVSASQVLDVYE